MRTSSRPSPAGMERPSAETTPAETEPAEPVRIADGDDELPDAQPVGVADLGGGERLRVCGARPGPTGVPAADLDAHLAAVDERRSHRSPADDDVRRGDEEPVRRDRDGRAAPASAPAAQHFDCGDRRRDPLRRLDHHPRIGVERLFVVQTFADERDPGHNRG